MVRLVATLAGLALSRAAPQGLFDDLLNEGGEITPTQNQLEDPAGACYLDNVTRDLNGDIFTIPTTEANGVLFCLSSCAEKQFIYAGVQATQWCLCGNTFGLYGPAPETDCNLPCADAGSGETCGAIWRSNVYLSGYTPEPIPEVPNGECFVDVGADRDLDMVEILMPQLELFESNVLWCQKHCGEEGYLYAGVHAQNWCLCGDSFGKHGLAPVDECNLTCNDEENFCGAQWRNNIYESIFPSPPTPVESPTPIEVPTGECFIDVGEDRDLSGAELQIPLVEDSIFWCRTTCGNLDLTYAAVQAMNWCLCGDSFGKHGQTLDEECNLTCQEGDSICGGLWRNNVYVSIVQEPTEIKETEVEEKIQHDPQGECYIDNGENRDLDGADFNVPTDVVNSIAWCQNACAEIELCYAAVQASNWCLCGESFGKYGQTLDEECNLTCQEGENTCGGFWRNNVYVSKRFNEAETALDWDDWNMAPSTPTHVPCEKGQEESCGVVQPETPELPTPVAPTPGNPTPGPGPVVPTPVNPTPDVPTPVEPTPIQPEDCGPFGIFCPTPVEPVIPEVPTPVVPMPVEPEECGPFGILCQTPSEPELEPLNLCFDRAGNRRTVEEGEWEEVSADPNLPTGCVTCHCIADDFGNTFVECQNQALFCPENIFMVENKEVSCAANQEPVVAVVDCCYDKICQMVEEEDPETPVAPVDEWPLNLCFDKSGNQRTVEDGDWEEESVDPNLPLGCVTCHCVADNLGNTLRECNNRALFCPINIFMVENKEISCAADERAVVRVVDCCYDKVCEAVGEPSALTPLTPEPEQPTPWVPSPSAEPEPEGEDCDEKTETLPSTPSWSPIPEGQNGDDCHCQTHSREELERLHYLAYLKYQNQGQAHD